MEWRVRPSFSAECFGYLNEAGIVEFLFCGGIGLWDPTSLCLREENGGYFWKSVLKGRRWVIACYG